MDHGYFVEQLWCLQNMMVFLMSKIISLTRYLFGQEFRVYLKD
jgi:hypothetical protein